MVHCWLFGVRSISAVEFKKICFGFGEWEWTLISDSPSDLELMVIVRRKGFFWVNVFFLLARIL